MAAQQIQIAETIRRMKLALKRRPDDSESDGEVNTYTNRGNKLKRTARYVREGHLDTTSGLAHRRRVEHAGYTRTTISTNPPLFDSDGERYSPPTSEDERHAEPLAENPFAQVQLETLLKPLVAVHELPNHPSLGVAYRSKALAQMSAEAAEMLRRERESLWRAKRLLGRFRGDADWAPCGIFETDGDSFLLQDDQTVDSRDSSAPEGKDGTAGALSEIDERARDAALGIETNDMALTRNERTLATAQEQQNEVGSEQKVPKPDEVAEAGMIEPESKDQPDSLAPPNIRAINDLQASADPSASETGSVAESANTHAMTTRARARSPQRSPSASPSPSDSASVPTIHPWFLLPSSSLPSRDLGLPMDEGENTRKLLLLYCQKQEQIIRSLETLYSGLQKGERLRGFVAASAKASGHLVPDGKNGLVTELSDGEDWYDPSEYGRLEKGKDEVEDVEEEGRRGGRRRRVVGRV